ncbi:MAG: hypothetical protein JNM43_11260 [Planctomycetaceae bacterium]|nr:hypothetical protein [Planctomycetaceae bacterium]
MNGNDVAELDRKMLDRRLDALVSNQHRSRAILVVASIASITFVSVAFNAYVSWSANSELGIVKTTLDAEKEGFRHDYAKAYLDRWMKSTSGTVSLFGATFTSDDIVLLSGISMVIISMWQLISLRREQLAIESLRCDFCPECTNDFQRAMARLIFHTFYSTSLFTTVSENGDTRSTAAEIRFRRLFHLMLWLPFLTLLVIVSLDVWSLLWPHPMRQGGQPLIGNLYHEGQLDLLLFWYMAGAAFLFVLFLIIKASVKSANETERMLMDLKASAKQSRILLGGTETNL